jgi:hypothetical protein
MPSGTAIFYSGFFSANERKVLAAWVPAWFHAENAIERSK